MSGGQLSGGQLSRYHLVEPKRGRIIETVRRLFIKRENINTGSRDYRN